MIGHFSTELRLIRLKLTPLGDLQVHERQKTERKIRRAVRRFSRMNREIDFGQVPPRFRVELGERVAEFGSVVKAFRLDEDQAYGDWLADFDVATMNVDAILQAFKRDYGTGRR